jgi:hypothetical protein
MKLMKVLYINVIILRRLICLILYLKQMILYWYFVVILSLTDEVRKKINKSCFYMILFYFYINE